LCGSRGHLLRQVSQLHFGHAGRSGLAVSTADTAAQPMGHGGEGARAPTFTNGWTRGALCVEEQQTRNLFNCTDHRESTHLND